MALLSYAYDIQINSDWHVRPGLNLQYSVLNLEFRKLIFSDQLTTGDATGRTTIELPPDNALKGDIDAAAAFLFYNQNIWFGTTVDHLFSPNMGLYADKSRVPYKISVFGGIQLNRQSVLIKPIDESLSFAYLYKRQGAFSQLDLGVYWAKIPAVFGFWYRGIPGFNSQRGDAISLLIGYKSYYFSIGYSYDFTVSGLVNSTYGAHEVSLLYPFVTSRRKKIHAVPCPQF